MVFRLIACMEFARYPILLYTEGESGRHYIWGMEHGTRTQAGREILAAQGRRILRHDQGQAGRASPRPGRRTRRADVPRRAEEVWRDPSTRNGEGERRLPRRILPQAV